jgi:hypothetical protein
MFHSCYYSKCCTQTMPSCIFMAASSPLSRSTHQTGSPSVCHRRVKWHVYLHRLKKVGRRACHTRASSYCCDATASPYGYTYYCVCEAYDLVSRQHRPAAVRTENAVTYSSCVCVDLSSSHLALSPRSSIRLKEIDEWTGKLFASTA